MKEKEGRNGVNNTERKRIKRKKKTGNNKK